MKKYKSMFKEAMTADDIYRKIFNENKIIVDYIAYLIDSKNKPYMYITNIISLDRDEYNSKLLKIECEGYERQRISSWGKSTTWNYVKFSKDSSVLNVTIPKNFFIKKTGSVKL